MGPLTLIVLSPLIGAALLLLFGGYFPKVLSGWIGTIAAAISAIAAGISIFHLHAIGSYREVLGSWLEVGNIAPRFSLAIDGMSALMIGVVTGIGFLIHVYAMGYMAKDPGIARFFGLLNLFVAAMAILVLADHLLILFLGWEGVGVCSFLLIGFWYREEANVLAARKAFLVTRVGDVALAIALFMIWTRLGTLSIPEVLQYAMPSPEWIPIALLLLVGAMGKSGQVPLHVWLPDAMAGPTPVSAMIHAATMVAAGVYLIARLSPLFVDPHVQLVISVVGGMTVLVAGLAALGQFELKKILAYSTISQLGYMFLALGAGDSSAALFHFTTHAAFKALLFLAAGLAIEAAHHHQDLRKIAGFGKRTPFLKAMFLIGCGSLAALPGVTSAFYSKDRILVQMVEHGPYGWWFAGIGLLGGAITAGYSFRLYFLLFGGPERGEVHDHSSWFERIPVAILAVLAFLFAGLGLPGWLAAPDFIGQILGQEAHHGSIGLEIGLQIASAMASLLGLGWAWMRFGKGVVHPASDWLSSGFGFDAAYHRLLVQPIQALVGVDRLDPIRGVETVGISITRGVSSLISVWQQGGLSTFTSTIVLGLVVLVVGWWGLQ